MFNSIASSQGYMYILLGTVVFVAPQFSDTLGTGSIANIITALLYIIGACFGLVQSIPVLTNANAAADRIVQLEALEPKTIPPTKADIAALIFRRSRCTTSDSVTWIDMAEAALHWAAGLQSELLANPVFITGGNGSGKSTLLRVLAGLYEPEIGRDPARRHARQQGNSRSVSRAVFRDFL